MTDVRTIDDVPVAHTPPGGWVHAPPPVLTGCVEPLPDDAPDLRGWWQVTGATIQGQPLEDHPILGLRQRIEQAGDRICITAAGVTHDMRCDGSEERGVNDVAEMDKETRIVVVATYEDGVHVLRPKGVPIEVTRRRAGDEVVWVYGPVEARCRYLGPAEVDPPRPRGPATREAPTPS